jgi:hypothetical protein
MIWALRNPNGCKEYADPWTDEMHRRCHVVQESKETVAVGSMLTAAMNSRGVGGKVFPCYGTFYWQKEGQSERTSTMALCSRALLGILEGHDALVEIHDAFGVASNNALMRLDRADMSAPNRPLRVVRQKGVTDGEQLVHWRMGLGVTTLSIEISRIDMPTVAALHAYANAIERLGSDPVLVAEIRAIASEFFLEVGPSIPTFAG